MRSGPCASRALSGVTVTAAGAATGAGAAGATGVDAGLLEVAPFFGFLIGPVVLALLTRVSSATDREERRWKARVDAG